MQAQENFSQSVVRVNSPLSEKLNPSRLGFSPVDVLVRGSGSLYIFQILTQRALDWTEENVSHDGFQPDFPNTIYVEHRYASDLAGGMIQAGLEVR